MKKLILLSAITLFCVATYSQVKISAGIKGGLNFSKIDVSNVTSSGKSGYHAGIYGLFKFAKVGIQPEILFSRQGSILNLDNWESKYVNIPILIKIYLAAGLNLQAGPQFGFLNKVELDGQDIKALIKSSDISAALGVGWDAPFRMTFNARYNLGLSDINDNLAYGFIKNQVFQISVGIKLFKLVN